MNIRLSAITLAVAAVHPFSSTIAAPAEQATVIVTAARQAQRADEALADMTVIEREQIERAGPSFSLPELLARQPGIQMSSNGGPGKATDISMRGTNSKHTLFLVDGMRLGSATLGSAAWQDIPLSQIERIEIVRGPASALYGADAIGGVIQVITKKGSGAPKVNAFVGAGSHGTREVSAGVAGGTEQISYSLRGGYSQTDSFSAQNRKLSTYNRDNDLYRNGNFSGSFAWRPTAGHEIGASVLYAESRSMYDSGRTYNNYNNAAQSAWSLYSRNRLSEGWASTLRFGQSIDDYENFASYAPQGATIKTTQEQLSWQNDIRLPIGSLLAAYENLHQKAVNEGTFDVSRTINSFLLGWTASLGAHKLQLNARHDDNTQYGGKTTGYAGYGYQINPSLRIQGSIASAFRAPTFNELYYPGYGNAGLKAESAYNKEVSLLWEKGGHNLSATYYRNRISNLIANDQNFIPQNVANARLEGVTLGYGGQWAGFDLNASVDFLDPKDLDTDKRLPRRTNQFANLSISRRLQALTVGTEWRGSGNRYDRAGEIRPMGGYGILNAYAKYALTHEWAVEGRVNNLLDKQYETAYGYNTPGANLFFGVRYAPK
ncbi:TonB-dependent receptor [Zoogloea sp.]|uniref:TonB-dependent receptor domain-containing protein n=1 Tax=Zoogloea sp. TaxID=49181 RepID=UPI00261DD326|nr:TonB-dependent receptor [Zoogloea sp.]MDD3352455.1 TonB-dependent receptor [Zoogloea sp.]